MTTSRLRNVALIMIPLSFGGLLLLNFNTMMQWKKTRYDSMESIARGLRNFDYIHRRLPTNLAEVVQAGNLPTAATFYSSSIKHHSLFGLPRKGFAESEFELVFTTNEVLITMDRITEASFLKRFPQFGKNQVRLLIQNGETSSISPK